MGEVYRARDARLSREVAIKVLPASVAADPDRRARFEREATAVAALSHPNILAIHDAGVDRGVAYAVMELLRGATLRERLQSGPLPVRKAVEAAVQIARGLAAAHDRGFVHRDLKPENVFLLEDGQVKILDFGLAKEASAPIAESATVAGPETDPGTVMGTVGYMAPEQVRAQAVDARADIFAFGAVLYEMVTGRRAFQRGTAAETMTAILKEDPQDLRADRADVPVSLDRIVHHCLEKLPAERFQSARDIAFALEALSGSGPSRTATPAASTRAGSHLNVPLLGAALVVTAVAAGAAGWWLRSAPPLLVRKLDFSIDGLSTGVGTTPLISPDGRHVLYSANTDLWVRPLDGLDAVELPDTAGATYASWSPDSRSVAYVKGGQLWRIALDAGKAITLGQVPPDMSGSGSTCWLPDGRILLAGSDVKGVTAISDRGGDLTTVADLDKTREIDIHEMSALPNGGVLFTVHHVASQRADSIEAIVNGARRTVLTLQGETLRQPVYSPTGHLIYHRESHNAGLWAVRFSLSSLTTQGEPFLLVPHASWPSLSADGTLSIVRPSDALPDLLWVDRAGPITRIATLPQRIGYTGDLGVLRLSPDGRRAVVSLEEASVDELWQCDLASGSIGPLTHGAGQALFPVWTPDGRSVIFAGLYGGRVWSTHRVTVETGAVEPMMASAAYQYPASISSDGRTFLLADTSNDGTLWRVALDAAGKASAPVRLTSSRNSEYWPMLSPDGRLVAYEASLNGRSEVYVRGVAPNTEPRLVSAGSASQFVGVPMWSPDGKELIYRDGDRLMSVMVTIGGSGLALSTPKAVATVPTGQGFSTTFDVAADGRFLMARTPGHDRIALVLNWPVDLKRVETSGVGR